MEVDPSSAALKAEILRQAHECGFDACRVAECAPPQHGAEFQNWLTEGDAGEMEWLERGAAKRLDPQQILPGARSVIVVAMNYWQGDADGPAPARPGRIARYAWGDDYHDVMLAKLRQLDDFLASAAACRSATSIPDRCWNATSRLQPASAGTARAPCSSTRSSVRGSSSAKS